MSFHSLALPLQAKQACMDMNTITIDPSLYRNMDLYAQENNVSIRELAENAISQFLDQCKKLIAAKPAAKVEKKERYLTSPTLKAVEVDYPICAKGLSVDYKKEIGEYRAKKYLYDETVS